MSSHVRLPSSDTEESLEWVCNVPEKRSYLFIHQVHNRSIDIVTRQENTYHIMPDYDNDSITPRTTSILNGSYALQAAIAALHARARTPAETDWVQISALYQRLRSQHDSAVVALNVRRQDRATQ